MERKRMHRALMTMHSFLLLFIVGIFLGTESERRI